MKYFAHSIRVQACESLDEAAKSPSVIEKRLMWMGEYCPVYLRDTHKVNDQHNLALEECSKVAMNLIDLNIDNQMQTLSGKDREESGEYDDGD